MKSYTIFISALTLLLQVSTIVQARSSYPASSHNGMRLDFDILRNRKPLHTEVKQSSYDVLEMLEWVFHKRPCCVLLWGFDNVSFVKSRRRMFRHQVSCFPPMSNDRWGWWDAKVFSFSHNGGTLTVRLFFQGYLSSVHCEFTWCRIVISYRITLPCSHTRFLDLTLRYSEGFLLIQGLLVRGGATPSNQVASWPGQNLDWNGDVRTNVELNMMGLWVRNSTSYTLI